MKKGKKEKVKSKEEEEEVITMSVFVYFRLHAANTTTQRTEYIVFRIKNRYSSRVASPIGSRSPVTQIPTRSAYQLMAVGCFFSLKIVAGGG